MTNVRADKPRPLLLLSILCLVIWIGSYVWDVSVCYGSYLTDSTGGVFFTGGVVVGNGVLHVGDVRGVFHSTFMNVRILPFRIGLNGWECKANRAHVTPSIDSLTSFGMHISPSRASAAQRGSYQILGDRVVIPLWSPAMVLLAMWWHKRNSAARNRRDAGFPVCPANLIVDVATITAPTAVQQLDATRAAA
jgi:hypothetical protein